MGATENTPGIVSARLPADQYDTNFADLHPPLDNHQAIVEADRCYFCDDAPCVQACPTGIDIPMFIRQIATGNPKGAGETILDQNIMGGMCARVCPTEDLCERVCVRNVAEEKPVRIGELQRHATDALMVDNRQVFERAAPTGKRIAVIGAGPAGLACAHALAVAGHDVVVHEARPKPGGLNEYGIAAYKTVDGFAQREVDYILSIGGISIEYGRALGDDLSLAALRDEFDAVFLGMGLGGVNDLAIEGEELEGVEDAVDYIAALRQADDLGTLPVGRNVVVIGGGMTAIDIAVQSKLLGADEVTLVYRRGPERMNASVYEQNLAQTRGVKIKHWSSPVRLRGENGTVHGVEFKKTASNGDGRLADTGETFTLDADMVFKAIGQTLVQETLGGELTLSGGRISVDENRRTSLPDVWAGGDCIEGGEDLTVAAVEDGKIAARAIDAFLNDTPDA